MRIFFSVGEPSGDLHGANLIRALKAQRNDDDLELVGYGGPLMAEVGCRLHEDLTQLAVMWFLRVLLNLHKFWNLVSRADRYFRHHRPDAVVLIDYPGFNWWIARRAKAHGIPVFYYGAPQIWAWAGWRIKKMRRLVDHVLCKLPFEERWYRQQGCRATYVGHPFFDEVLRHPMDTALVAAQRTQPDRLVAILPGSRTQEVTHNLPFFLKAAVLVHRQVPDARFAIAAFREQHAEMARQMIAEAKLDGKFPLEILVRRTPELIHLAHACMAASGSVSLELLHHRRPTVILYWISRPAFFVQNFFRKVKYITLVNLLWTKNLFREDRSTFEPRAAGAEQVPFPEYLTCQDRSADISWHITRWLQSPEAHGRSIGQLETLCRRVGAGGASKRAAAYILSALAQHGRPAQPRPHYQPPATRGAQRQAA